MIIVKFGHCVRNGIELLVSFVPEIHMPKVQIKVCLNKTRSNSEKIVSEFTSLMPCSQFSCFGRHRMVEDASDLMSSPKFSRNDSLCRSLFILVETDKAGQFQWII